jgi:hypothetical protein
VLARPAPPGGPGQQPPAVAPAMVAPAMVAPAVAVAPVEGGQQVAPPWRWPRSVGQQVAPPRRWSAGGWPRSVVAPAMVSRWVAPVGGPGDGQQVAPTAAAPVSSSPTCSTLRAKFNMFQLES